MKYTKVGNYYIRRPQAAQVEPETWRSAVRHNWPEIIFGVLILLSLWIGIPWLAGLTS